MEQSCLSFLRTSIARLMVFAEFCIRQFLAYFNETACVEDGAGVTYPCNRESPLRMEPVRLLVDEDTRGFLVGSPRQLLIKRYPLIDRFLSPLQ